MALEMAEAATATEAGTVVETAQSGTVQTGSEVVESTSSREKWTCGLRVL